MPLSDNAHQADGGMIRTMRRNLFALLLLGGLASCGDGGAESAAPFPAANIELIPSVSGEDRLLAVTAAPNESFFAAGLAAGAAGQWPTSLILHRFSAAGRDETFGSMGHRWLSTDFVGGPGEIDVTTLPDGRVVIAATVIAEAQLYDFDVGVLVVDPQTGLPDESFAFRGLRRFNLNTPIGTGAALTVRDAARGITVDSAGRIYLLAASRGTGIAAGGGPRIDTDFTVARLTVDGALDDSWGTEGIFRLDIDESDATPHAILALADGSVIIGGHADTVGSIQPVLFKLDANGALDTSWAEGGLFHEVVLDEQTATEDFVIHGSYIVACGTGRDTGTQDDFIALRFDLATGARDTSWGTVKGAAMIDASRAGRDDRCHAAVSLPGGRVAMLGSTGPAGSTAQDAALVILKEDGTVDDSSAYGDGLHVVSFGANGDQFLAGAASGSVLAMVGYKGGPAVQTSGANDDVRAMVMPLQ